MQAARGLQGRATGAFSRCEGACSEQRLATHLLHSWRRSVVARSTTLGSPARPPVARLRSLSLSPPPSPPHLSSAAGRRLSRPAPPPTMAMTPAMTPPPPPLPSVSTRTSSTCSSTERTARWSNSWWKWSGAKVSKRPERAQSAHRNERLKTRQS